MYFQGKVTLLCKSVTQDKCGVMGNKNGDKETQEMQFNDP